MKELEQQYGIEKAEEIQESVKDFMSRIKIFYRGEAKIKRIGFEIEVEGVQVVVFSDDITKPY